jgi:hypothetical protein
VLQQAAQPAAPEPAVPVPVPAPAMPRSAMPGPVMIVMRAVGSMPAERKAALHQPLGAVSSSVVVATHCFVPSEQSHRLISSISICFRYI